MPPSDLTFQRFLRRTCSQEGCILDIILGVDRLGTLPLLLRLEIHPYGSNVILELLLPFRVMNIV